MSEPILTPADIAERTQTSEWWVREQCKSGALTASKLADKWRIKESDYEIWFDGFRHVPETTNVFAGRARSHRKPKTDRLTLSDVA